MTVAVSPLVQQAVRLHQTGSGRLPASVEVLADEIHALDAHLAMRIKKELESDGVDLRAGYQQLRRDAAGAAKARHAAAGTGFGQAGLYFPGDLHAQVPAPGAPRPELPKKKEPPKGPGFTPFGMTRAQRELHDAKVNALADLARRAATERLSPEQQKAAHAEIAVKAEKAELAAEDVRAAAAHRQAKIDALPWILRTLVQQIQGWSSYGEDLSSGKDGAEKPSLYGKLLKNAYK